MGLDECIQSDRKGEYRDNMEKSIDICDEIRDDTIRYICFELYKVIRCDLDVYK